MKKNQILTLLISCLALLGCSQAKSASFGIYLLSEEMRTDQFQVAGLESLALQDKPLISSADIVSYDQATHEITLTPAAFQRVQSLYKLPVDVDGLPFVVCVGDERIYRGAFWTPVSSLSYDGVFILQPMGQDNRITLLAGYPSHQLFSGPDPRSDPRIMGALAAEGKLK
jgi:hypothetical protein